MSVMQCSLCSYEYNDELEDVPWAESAGRLELPDLRVSEVCLRCSGKDKGRRAGNMPVPADPGSGIFECKLCANLYDEKQEAAPWNQLADDWKCPVCGATKDLYDPVAGAGGDTLRPRRLLRQLQVLPSPAADYLSEWKRTEDSLETHMADIHRMAETGQSVYEPMRSKMPVFSWNEILIKGAQLSRLPLNATQPVSTRTVIGPGAAVPLVLETPIIVSHMSFGALSREAKLALAKGSAAAGAAMCSGEGGILPESLEASYKYIFEYVPNKYSVNDENLSRVDAVEIKFGQSAKPGMGGHLPGHKVTREIAEIRGFREGADIISPSHFPDIRTREQLKDTIDMLRTKKRRETHRRKAGGGSSGRRSGRRSLCRSGLCYRGRASRRNGRRSQDCERLHNDSNNFCICTGLVKILDERKAENCFVDYYRRNPRVFGYCQGAGDGGRRGSPGNRVHDGRRMSAVSNLQYRTLSGRHRHSGSGPPITTERGYFGPESGQFL